MPTRQCVNLWRRAHPSPNRSPSRAWTLALVPAQVGAPASTFLETTEFLFEPQIHVGRKTIPTVRCFQVCWKMIRKHQHFPEALPLAPPPARVFAHEVGKGRLYFPSLPFSFAFLACFVVILCDVVRSPLPHQSKAEFMESIITNYFFFGAFNHIH